MQLQHTFFLLCNAIKKLLLLLFLMFSNQLHSQIEDSAFIENIYTAGWQLIHTNPDSAAILFEKAKKESDRQQYFPGLIMYYNYNAALQIALNHNEKAFEYYDEAIAIAKSKNLVTDLGLTYMKKGTLSQFMGDYGQAAECYLAAASVLKTNEDRKKIIGLYKNMLPTLNNLQQQNQSLQNVLPALKNDNTDEKEIVSILSQKKTNKASLYFSDQTTIQEVTGGNIFVIFGGAKFRIIGFDELGKYNNYRSINKIPDGMLSRIPDIPVDGTILRQLEDGGKVYLIKDKQRHRIANTQVLQFFGGWDALCTVPGGTLEQVPDAGDSVTMQNVMTTFNFKKEYEVLIDTLETTLLQNNLLLSEVGKKLKSKNNILQKRKILLWSSLLSIAALLCIGFLLVRNSRQKQKMHQQSLQALKAEQELQRSMELEKERTRIATDMHDDLGAGLTRIKFIAENMSEKTTDTVLHADMKKLKTSSIEMVENMAEIIWAMDEKNNTLEDLLFYLRSYAIEYCTENRLSCNFLLPENIPQIIIGGQIRRNLFLVLKESLHNIVKHAVAGKVIIDISANENLSFSITDDGKGFEKEKQQPGNGLLNMQKRSDALKGKLWINNTKGVTIRLEVPLLNNTD